MDSHFEDTDICGFHIKKPRIEATAKDIVDIICERRETIIIQFLLVTRNSCRLDQTFWCGYFKICTSNSRAEVADKNKR